MPGSRRDFILTAAGSLQPESFRIAANLVVVRFSVMKGRNFVAGLRAEDVVVTEDGREQRIALFEAAGSDWHEQQEIDFRILVDLSGSAKRYRVLTAELLVRALVGVFGKRAAVSLYGFAFDCQRLAGPTWDSGELNAGMTRLGTVDVQQKRRSASRIFDAVVQVAGEPSGEPAKTHPVMVIFSDGLNSGNRMALDDAVRAALSAATTVYPVLLAAPGQRDDREGALIEQYGKMGAATGGRSFWPASFTEER